MVSGGARRLDWHVLLPVHRQTAPDRWLLLGAGPDLPRVAVELGLAGSATAVAEPGQPDDVVALLHSADRSLGDAVRSLAPDGCLYWEVDRRSLRSLATTPGRARRRLRAAGLAQARVYLVGHGWARPNRFVPADPGVPLDWQLASAAPFRGRIGARVWRIVRRSGLASWLAALVAPRFAVIATSKAGAATTPTVLRHPDLPAAIRSSVISPILVTGGQEDWARLSLLAFADDGSEPSLIVKVSRLGAYDEATRREHEVIARLRADLDDATGASLPEAIALLESDVRPTSVQGFLPGSPAQARMKLGPRNGTTSWRDFELTAAWLTSLARQTERSRVHPGSPGWAAHVEHVLSRFGDAFGRPPEVDRLFRDLHDHTTAVGADIPIVQCHGDVGPWNVLVDGDQIGVIDWEVAGDGPALTDLLYASIHWTFEVRGLATEGDRRRELRRLLSGGGDPDAATSSIGAAVRRYVEALRIDHRLVAPLVVLTMVRQALDRFDRLARVNRADPQPWVDNRYAGYVAELATLGESWIAGVPLFGGAA